MKTWLQLILFSILASGLTGCPQSAGQSAAESSSAPAAETAASASSLPAATHRALVGDPAKGPALMTSKTCGTCHLILAVAAAKGTIGPSLDGIATRAATRVKGLSAEAYLHQSIEQPQVFVVPDYQPVMPALRTTLSDQEYADLIAYLLTLKS